MDLSIYKTNDANEIVITDPNKKNYSILAIVLGVGFILYSITYSSDTLSSPYIPSLRILLILVYLLVFLYKYLDDKIKVLINQNGVGYSTNFIDDLIAITSLSNFKLSVPSLSADGIGYKQSYFKWEDIVDCKCLKEFKQSLWGNQFTYSLVLTTKTSVEPVLINLPIHNLQYENIQRALNLYYGPESGENSDASSPTLGPSVARLNPSVANTGYSRPLHSSTSIEEIMGTAAKDDFVVNYKFRSFWVYLFLTPFIFSGICIAWFLLMSGANVLLGIDPNKSKNYTSAQLIILLIIWVALVALVVWLLIKRHKKVLLRINKVGIFQDDKAYYWRDVRSYCIKVFVLGYDPDDKRNNLNFRQKGVPLCKIILTNKMDQPPIIININPNGNKTVAQIDSVIKSIIANMDIENLGLIEGNRY